MSNWTTNQITINGSKKDVDKLVDMYFAGGTDCGIVTFSQTFQEHIDDVRVEDEWDGFALISFQIAGKSIANKTIENLRFRNPSLTIDADTFREESY